MLNLLKKYFKNRIFLFLIINTASACILFIVYYEAKKIKKYTRTFACIVDKVITQDEVNNFLENLTLPNKCEILFQKSELYTYEQRITFQIKYKEVNPEDIVEDLNKQWAEQFKNRCINLYSMKKNPLPKVIYNDTKGVVVVSNCNNFKGKIPEYLTLQSCSTTSENIMIYNMIPFDNSSKIEAKEQARLMVIGKKHHIPQFKDKALLAIKTNNETIFFEIERLIFE